MSLCKSNVALYLGCDWSAADHVTRPGAAIGWMDGGARRGSDSGNTDAAPGPLPPFLILAFYTGNQPAPTLTPDQNILFMGSDAFQSVKTLRCNN